MCIYKYVCTYNRDICIWGALLSRGVPDLELDDLASAAIFIPIYIYIYIYIYRDERRPRTDWESLSKGNPYPCPKKLYRLPAVLFVLYNGVIHIVMHCCLYIVCYTNFRLYFFVKHLLCKLCFVIHDCLVYTSFVIHCLCICYT